MTERILSTPCIFLFLCIPSCIFILFVIGKFFCLSLPLVGALSLCVCDLIWFNTPPTAHWLLTWQPRTVTHPSTYSPSFACHLLLYCIPPCHFVWIFISSPVMVLFKLSCDDEVSQPQPPRVLCSVLMHGCLLFDIDFVLSSLTICSSNLQFFS